MHRRIVFQLANELTATTPAAGLAPSSLRRRGEQNALEWRRGLPRLPRRPRRPREAARRRQQNQGERRHRQDREPETEEEELGAQRPLASSSPRSSLTTTGRATRTCPKTGSNWGNTKATCKRTSRT